MWKRVRYRIPRHPSTLPTERTRRRECTIPSSEGCPQGGVGMSVLYHKRICLREHPGGLSSARPCLPPHYFAVFPSPSLPVLPALPVEIDRRQCFDYDPDPDSDLNLLSVPIRAHPWSSLGSCSYRSSSSFCPQIILPSLFPPYLRPLRGFPSPLTTQLSNDAPSGANMPGVTDFELARELLDLIKVERKSRIPAATESSSKGCFVDLTQVELCR